MSFEYAKTDAAGYSVFLRSYNKNFKRRVYIRTFGCQQNEADSEKIAGILTDAGYILTDTYKDADVIILNTCAIREHAEKKVFSLLGVFKARKRENPELIIGVVGCMGAVSKTVEMLKRDFHYVSFTLGAGAMHRIPELIYRAVTGGGRSFMSVDDREEIVENMPYHSTAPHRAYVSIMYGCNNFCSYCIVPYTRGRERSRDSADIINECKAFVVSGVREIMLLGQNVNSYRSDMDFPALLAEIARIPGDFIIRFMTSHPKDVSMRLIDVMARYTDKIAPYFHLPLQSGSDRVLRDMNRTYTQKRFLNIASALKERIPDIALTTDVIVGFPGETEEDFEDTLAVLESVRFDAVYAFLYSPREGTPAAARSDFLADEVKADRMARLLAMQDNISLECNLKYVNKIERVLVDGESSKKGTYSARTASNKLVHFASDTPHIGEFVYVKIDRAGAYDLIGTVQENKIQKEEIK